MSRNDPQMKLRLPLEIKNEIERIAQESGRSMNAEIVRRLEWVLGDGKNHYAVDGPDYHPHVRVKDDSLQIYFPGSRYKEDDFPDADNAMENNPLNSDEMAIIEAWRSIDEEDRSALLIAFRNARIASRLKKN
ncbi:Arc family DNA-binding protein [Gluconobacter aidae]|uniref:Arc family DNA-binding protein n=1 Tax=Gluconobacter aidae TaxID=2662454 RepID=A0A7X1SS62_9PROT|nr:Arc family DNA-binding protein [Gluconobacter aidae]MQS00159.1 Arc family DNA-binding protein [Gluconobacter aidae]